jgi:hypothetical protein
MKTQTILIPTDFSGASFDCIPALAEQFNGRTLNLVFTHLFKLSDSITDLLMLSRRNKEYQYIKDDFYTRCHEIRARYPQIESIKIEFFYGSTLSTFKNFLQANNITGILDPGSCTWKKLNSQSVEPASLLGRVTIPVVAARRDNSINSQSIKEDKPVLQEF